VAMVQGGCFCGALRYEVDPVGSAVVNCHCSMCRKTSGAPFVTWILLARDRFALIAGTPAELASSDHGRRWFCRDCGTPIAFLSSKRPDKLDVTACTLDDPAECPPTEDVYEETRLAWVQRLDTEA